MEKLKELQSGARRVDPDEKKAVDQKSVEFAKEWKKRKRLVIFFILISNVPFLCLV